MDFLCAQEWIRTITPVKALRPEHSASTNFATWAVKVFVSGSAKVIKILVLPIVLFKKLLKYPFQINVGSG